MLGKRSAKVTKRRVLERDCIKKSAHLQYSVGTFILNYPQYSLCCNCMEILKKNKEMKKYNSALNLSTVYNERAFFFLFPRLRFIFRIYDS
jgi:hypothetical protein